MADKSDDLDKDTLKIGDYVIFHDVVRRLFLGVEGILLEDLVATDGISLQDSIFCVHLQRQYSASRDLNAFLENYGGDEKKIEDESAKKYLLALKRGLENEKKLNDTYMRKKYGQKVNFGDIIQLFHVKSGKYVTIIPDKLAKDERENITVTLDLDGNAFSWLQIYPRFKIDKEGDRVLNKAEMYLKVAERSNEFIHSADRPPLQDYHREVNCALESTSWKLVIYQSSSDSMDPSILLASQLVLITDPETRSNLTVAKGDLESLDEKVMLRTASHLPATAPNNNSSSNNLSGLAREGSSSVHGFANMMMENDEEAEAENYFHDYGDTVLEPIPPDNTDSNHMWFIEGSSLQVGGPIRWKTEHVRFKHMNSGLYLRMLLTAAPTNAAGGGDNENEETGNEETGVRNGVPESNESNHDNSELIHPNEQRVVFTTTRNPYEEGTLFHINELNSTNKFLSNSKALQIGHNGVWMERGEVLEDSVFTFMVKGTRDKAMAVSLMIHRFGSSSKQTEEKDEAEIAGEGVGGSHIIADSKEPMDVFSGLAARDYLRKYHDMTTVPRSDSVSTVWPTSIRTDMDFFHRVVERTIFFTQGFPISANDIQLGIDKAEQDLRKRRQNLVREQGILEVVLRMINLLVPVAEKLDRIKKVQTTKRKKSVVSDEELTMINMGQLILNKCFKLLYYAILDNPENQMYAADFMPVLLAHLNAQPLAGKSVTEMLSKNLELQETKIGTREIQIFVDKLRSSKMNAMYLQLLQSCCSCEGAGVDGNQCKVANMLFSDTNDIIINLHADYARTRVVPWEIPSLYVPPTLIPGSPVYGYSLITKGLPQLSLAWTTNSIDFSPLGLFGKLSVNVEELFKSKTFAMLEDSRSGAANGAIKKKSKKKSSAEQKEAVANYFVAEMFLGAEMCMDRNYVAMHKLDPLFPYDTLVAILKYNVSTNLKSAAVRLLMCLYVDRDPQAISKIPLLTRTWSDIKKNAEPQLPYVDVARRYTFGIIQQMLSEHVRDMAGNRWDELSQHMLKMLRTLVQFNFYGTNERMRDVIAPLIQALDRRNVAASVGDFGEVAAGGSGKNHHSPGSPKKSNANASGAANHGEGHAEDSMVSPAARGGGEGGGGGRNSSPQRGGGGAMSPRGKDDIEGKEEEKGDTDYMMDYTDNYDEMDDDDDRRGGHRRGGPWYVSLAKGLYKFTVNLFTLGQAAQIIALLDDAENKTDSFKMPLRYSKAPIYELETMVEAVDILAFAQRVIEDRNISLLLRSFFAWESGSDKRTPAELFEQVVEDSNELTLDIADFDNVMIDVLMFVHTPLMQSTLEVLMAHHSMRRTLLDNASNVQLLASHKRERQYKMVDQMLQQLEQNAETHELWGELESDADHLLNKQTKDILTELTDFCRIRRTVLEFDEDYMADADIQNLYRNLGCFEICMKVMGLLDSVEEDEDGNLDEVAQNTRDLCLLCNTLLYWFLLGNPKNQQLGFNELELFVDTLDDEIKSHLVIKAIFKNNESLMRQVPHSLLSDLVDKIFKDGMSHHYLSLFTSICNVGEKNIVENQFEIVKQLTSPGRLQKVSCYLVPVDSPEYQEKREAMAEFLGVTRDLSLDELEPKLAYHLMFLDVLSGCTVGRLNITTVEAKVQSVFNYFDMCDSILDPGTILVAKIIMTKFIFNAVIEVELVIPGLEKSLHIWRLFDSYQAVLQDAKAELQKVEQFGWEEVSRQKIEYIIVCCMMIEGFFNHYFDMGSFRGSEGHKKGEKAKYTKSVVSQMIVSFFHKIKDIYDLESPVLSEEMKVMLRTTLEALKRQGSKFIHVHIPVRGAPSSESLALTKTQVSNNENLTASTPSKNPFARSNSMKGNSAAAVAPAPVEKVPLSPEKKKEESEKRLIGKYQEFLKQLSSDTDIQYKAENENVAFISILEQLPFVAAQVDSDVRYETLIRKLVSHIRENIKLVNNQKRMDARVTKTSTWIIRAFRTMIENRMGMSIYERDDEGGMEQDIEAAPVVNALNSCGATALCLDLIADGIDEGLQLEAIRLGVGLLFKEGGALEVQGIMHNHLSKTNSELFFKQVRLTLQKLQAWHTWHEVIILEEDEEPSPPDDILIVRFLQLMCEGHYLPNQDIMREQPNNPATYNLLDDFVNYLNCLSRIPCRTSSVAGIRLAATILEVIQGPCEGNQSHFALSTELVEALNRMNRAKLINDCEEDEEIELKKTSIEIFQALLEGQGENSVVYDRVLSVIHLDIIQMMSKRNTLSDGLADEGKGAKEPTEELVILQTECVVLLQMLCNYKPSLYDELGISRNVEDIVGSGTAMIEVIWRGDIHRRFFHVPNVCEFLAKASKDNLVENVDRRNAENKLIDFLHRAHTMYREVKHQQLLTELGISGIFSRQNQNLATWITFFLAILINTLFISDYSHRTGKPEISPLFNQLTTYINIIQAVVSSFTLILWLVVRSPVNYQTFEAAGYSRVETIIRTATDPLTVYYVVYLIISFLGVLVENYYCSLLLLDIIVKNSTTGDVLMAIVTPRKQLGMAMLLECFVIYIYSFFIFSYYQDDIEGFCNTMWNCLKTTMSYGLQNGGGIGDFFIHSVGQRLLLDLSFYIIVIVILLNVIFGIIIDTFSSLRVDKLNRNKDTQEICFICGIDKQIFDRASDEPDGFKTHVKIDHNMWNYMYFIFMLWEQDKDDDDGLEQYVRRAIDANEITWFPMNKAMRLEQVANKSELLRTDLKDSVKTTESNLSEKLDEFQTDINVMFQQLLQTLKQENQAQDEKPNEVIVDGHMNDESLGEQSAESSYVDQVVLGHHFSIGVKSVKGLQMAQEELEAISCRIVCETGMYSFQGVTVSPNSFEIMFDESNLLPLFDNVQPKDYRVFQLQVLQGQGLATMKFVAVVEISLMDLITDLDLENKGQLEQTILTEKKFTRLEQTEFCSMTIAINCVPAITFGREDENVGDTVTED